MAYAYANMRTQTRRNTPKHKLGLYKLDMNIASRKNIRQNKSQNCEKQNLPTANKPQQAFYSSELTKEISILIIKSIVKQKKILSTGMNDLTTEIKEITP